MKRITIAALAAGVLLGWLGIRFFRKNAKKKMIILLTLIGIVALGYIFAVRMGLYDWLEARGLDSMGRSDIYPRVYDWYEMGPGYFGRGAGIYFRIHFHRGFGSDPFRRLCCGGYP